MAPSISSSLPAAPPTPAGIDVSLQELAEAVPRVLERALPKAARAEAAPDVALCLAAAAALTLDAAATPFATGLCYLGLSRSFDLTRAVLDVVHVVEEKGPCAAYPAARRVLARAAAAAAFDRAARPFIEAGADASAADCGGPAADVARALLIRQWRMLRRLADRRRSQDADEDEPDGPAGVDFAAFCTAVAAAAEREGPVEQWAAALLLATAPTEAAGRLGRLSGARPPVPPRWGFEQPPTLLERELAELSTAFAVRESEAVDLNTGLEVLMLEDWPRYPAPVGVPWWLRPIANLARRLRPHPPLGPTVCIARAPAAGVGGTPKAGPGLLDLPSDLLAAIVGLAGGPDGDVAGAAAAAAALAATCRGLRAAVAAAGGPVAMAAAALRLAGADVPRPAAVVDDEPRLLLARCSPRGGRLVAFEGVGRRLARRLPAALAAGARHVALADGPAARLAAAGLDPALLPPYPIRLLDAAVAGLSASRLESLDLHAGGRVPPSFWPLLLRALPPTLRRLTVRLDVAHVDRLLPCANAALLAGRAFALVAPPAGPVRLSFRPGAVLVAPAPPLDARVTRRVLSQLTCTRLDEIAVRLPSAEPSLDWLQEAGPPAAPEPLEPPAPRLVLLRPGAAWPAPRPPAPLGEGHADWPPLSASSRALLAELAAAGTRVFL